MTINLPKYAFRVDVDYDVGSKRWRETKNFESIQAAIEYRYAIQGKPTVLRITILSVLDVFHPRSGG